MTMDELRLEYAKALITKIEGPFTVLSSTEGMERFDSLCDRIERVLAALEERATQAQETGPSSKAWAEARAIVDAAGAEPVDPPVDPPADQPPEPLHLVGPGEPAPADEPTETRGAWTPEKGWEWAGFRGGAEKRPCADCGGPVPGGQACDCKDGVRRGLVCLVCREPVPAGATCPCREVDDSGANDREVVHSDDAPDEPDIGSDESAGETDRAQEKPAYNWQRIVAYLRAHGGTARVSEVGAWLRREGHCRSPDDQGATAVVRKLVKDKPAVFHRPGRGMVGLVGEQGEQG